MIRPTRHGYLLLALLGFFYLASVTSQSGLLLTIMGVVLACFVLNWVRARQTLRAIQVSALPATTATEGQPVTEPWQFLNRSRQWAGVVRVQSPAGLLCQAGPFAPGEAVPAPLLARFARRGVYPLGRCWLECHHPFGLVTSTRALVLPGEIIVYPAVYPCDPPRAAGFDMMVGGKHKGRRRVASGIHFAGIRPMLAGDSWRQIHWKSSAKGQGMMVKTFDEELSGRVTLLLGPATPGQTGWFDDAVRAAGSLMFAALDDGDHVEWRYLGDQHHHLLTPFSDANELLESLARLEVSTAALAAEAWVGALKGGSNRGAVCLVLAAWDPAWLPGLERAEKNPFGG